MRAPDPCVASRTARPRRRVVGCALVLAAACGAVVAPQETTRAHAAAGDPVTARRSSATWAWCGVNPDDATADASVRSMAVDAGIDVTFGPCNQPTGPYSPVAPGDRYSSPAVYARLVDLNAKYGVKTVVYDARLWSENNQVRAAAISEWTPRLANIAAWDLGDEFDPKLPEWAVLQHRWQLVESHATALTGVQPFANFMSTSLHEATTQIPGTHRLLSFASYFFDRGAALAAEFGPNVDLLMCGVNAFTHHGLTPTAADIEATMVRLRRAGCDQFLVFGGHRVYGTDEFGTQSLTDAAGRPTDWAGAVLRGAREPDAGFNAVDPGRVLDTRVDAGAVTVDGIGQAIGRLAGGSTTQLALAGRAGVPSGARSVEVVLSVVAPEAPGFVTLYPCDVARPATASATHATATVTTKSVTVPLDRDGRVCIFTLVGVDVVVDVTGYQGAASWFVPLTPARLLDSRPGPGSVTVDGAFAAIGLRPDATTTELAVGGRAGIPADAKAVVLDVTVTEPTRPGILTVHPCGRARPATADVVYAAGATVAGMVTAEVGTGGLVCLYDQSETHLVVDVVGYYPADGAYAPVAGARLLETRRGVGSSTADGQFNGLGVRAAGSTTELVVAGRGGVAPDATAASIVITATEARAGGFVTAYPCGVARPTVAMVSFQAGATGSNAVTVGLGVGGKVCLYTNEQVQLIVDVTGYHPSR